MNNVVLMGRLARDPEIRYTQGENPMCIARYTLAVDRRRTNANGEREADFISCVVFGKQAEFAEKYLHKGTKIVVNGRIQTGSYTNKEGKVVYTTEVAVNDQEFAESKSAASGVSQAPQNAQNRQRQQPQGQAQPFINQGFDDSGFMDIPDGIEDEALPFN